MSELYDDDYNERAQLRADQRQANLDRLRRLTESSQIKQANLQGLVEQKQLALPTTVDSFRAANLRGIEQLKQAQEEIAFIRARQAQDENALSTSVASFGVGSGALAEGAGTLYGLASGDMDNAARDYGKDIREYYSGRRSTAYTDADARRQQKMAAAEGFIDTAAVGFLETLTNPELAVGMFAENLPNLAVMGGIGGVAVKGTGSAVAGTSAAIGTGAGLQGADVGSNSYDRVMQLGDDVLRTNEDYLHFIDNGATPQEAKEKLALKASRLSGSIAFATSVVSQALFPAVPQILSGTAARGTTGSFVKAIVGETVQEGFEEGTGALAGNYGVQQVDASQALDENVAESTGIGAAGGMLTTVPIAGIKTIGDNRQLAAEERAANQAKQILKFTRVKEAVETGDFSALEDPDEVLNAVVQRSKLDDVDSAETSAQLDDIGNALDAQRIANAERKVEILDAVRDSETKKPTAEQKAELDQIEQKRKALDEYQKDVTTAKNDLVATQRATPDELEAQLDKAIAGDVEAKNNTIALLSKDPEALNIIAENNIEKIDALETSEFLNDSEKEIVRRFSAQHAAINSLQTTEDVNQQILTIGRDGFKGLQSYVTDVYAAIRSGNTEAAVSNVDNLSSFETQHRNKLAGLKAAQEELNNVELNQKKTVWLTRDDSSPIGWTVTTGKAPKGFAINQGEFTFNSGPKSQAALTKMIQDVSLEADAITATASQLSNAVETGTTAPTTKAASPAPVETEVSAAETTVEDAPAPSLDQKRIQRRNDQIVNAKDNVEKLTAAIKLREVAENSGTAEDIAFADSIIAELKALGFEELPLLGEKYSEGMKVTADFVSDDTVPEGQIIRVNTPQINENGVMVQAADIVVSTGPASQVEDASGEQLGFDLDNPGERPTTDEEAEAQIQAGIEEQAAATVDEETTEVPVETESEPVGVKTPFLNVAEDLIVKSGELTMAMLEDNAFPLLANFFTQNLEVEEGQLSNPLLTITDWAEYDESFTAEELAPFIEGEITEDQYDHIYDLVAVKNSVGAAVARMITEGTKTSGIQKQFRLTNYAGNLIGLVDSNMQTAIAYAIISEVGTLVTADRKKMLAILNLDEDKKFIANEDIAMFEGDKIDLQHNVMEAIGRRVINALGIKARSNALENSIDQFALSLGEYIVGYLQSGKNPLFETHQRKSSDGHTYNLIGFHPDMSSNWTNVIKGEKALRGFLDDLFSVQRPRVMPATEEGSFNQKSKRGGTDLTEAQKEIGNKASNDAYRFSNVMKDMRKKLTPAAQNAIGGAVNLGKLLPGRRKNAEAKNRSIEQEIIDLKNAEDTFGDNEVYLPWVFWRQNRAGLESSVINPQASKVQRAHMYQPDWEFDVEITENGNSATENALKLGVALGIAGIEEITDPETGEAFPLTFAVDKVKPDQVIESFDALKTNTAWLNAVAVIKDHLQKEGGITEEEFAALWPIIRDGEENFHSFASLITWAEYELAKEQNQPTYKANLFFEIDGLTNGPALSMILTGTATLKQLNQFGFYLEENYSYLDYRTKDGVVQEDFYQSFAKTLNEELGKIHSNPRQHIEAATLRAASTILQITRSTAKTPIQTTTFGSTSGTALASLAEEILEGYYERVEKIIYGQKPAATRNELEERIKDVNALSDEVNAILGYRSTKSKRPSVTFTLPEIKSFDEKQLEKLWLSPNQENNFREAFIELLQTPMETTINQHMGDFTYARDLSNWVGESIFARYMDAKKFFTKRKLAELREANLIGNTDVLPIYAVREIEAQLRDLSPTIHTLFSLRENNSKAGWMAKSGKERRKATEEERRSYTQRITLNKSYQSIPFVKGRKQVGGEYDGMPIKETRTYGHASSVREESSPGKATFVSLIHALDAFIAHSSVAELKATNVHDALLLSIGDIEAASELLNSKTFEALANYSIYDVLVIAMEESITAEESLIQEYGREFVGLLDNSLTEQQQKTKDGFFAPPYADQNFAGLLSTVQATGLKQDTIKANQLNDVNSVTQYVAPNHSHQVDENTTVVAPTATETLETLAEKIEVQKTNSNWGKVRSSDTVTVNSELYNAVKETNGKPAKLLLSKIIDYVEHPLYVKNVNAFTRKLQKHLLFMVKKALPANAKVMFIDPTTPIESWAKEVEGSKGFYKVIDGVPTIGIMSPEFIGGNISTFMLIHEMLHAVTQAIIDNPRTKEQKEAVENLTAIYEAYKETNNSEYNSRVNSIHELVAYGLTDLEFQDVLAGIQVTLPNQVEIKNGFQSFVDTLTKLIFGKNRGTRAEGERSALGALIHNAASIMKEDIDNATTVALRADESPTPPEFTTEQIFDSLASQSPNVDNGHAASLRTLLNNIVNTAYGPAGVLRAAPLRQAPLSADDVYLNNVAQGNTPFTTRFTNLLGMSQQEGFVGESLHIAMATLLEDKRNAKYYNELINIFNYAKANINGSDLHADPVIGEQIKNEIFTINATGKSDYLSEFVAASMTYKPLKDALLNIALPEKVSITSRIMAIVDRLLARWRQYSIGVTSNHKAYNAIQIMADRMAQQEAKRQRAILRKLDSPLTHLETLIGKGTEAGFSVANKAFSSKLLSDSKYSVLGMTSIVGQSITGKDVDSLMKSISSIYTRQFKNKQLGLMGSLWNEVNIGNKGQEWAVKLADSFRAFQQQKNQTNIELSNWILERFKTRPTDDQLHALTRVLIRADVDSLGLTVVELRDLLMNVGSVWDTKITSLETRLNGPTANYFINQAKGLGLHLATGDSKVAAQNLNAHNISLALHTDLNPSTAESQKAEPIIDQLATLYALQYMKSIARGKDSQGNPISLIQHTLDVLSNEYNRGDDRPNAINDILTFSKSQKEESLDGLFRNNPTLVQKGYISEITDPNISIKSAVEAEGKQLEKAGYVKISGVMEGDPNDPTSGERSLYAIHDGGISETVGSVMSTTGRTHSGWAIISKSGKRIKRVEIESKVRVQANKLNNIDHKNYDPSIITSPNRVVPIYNESGVVTDYRYMMTEKSKDLHLQREIPIHKVIGLTQASIFDKMESTAINRQAVLMMKKEYDHDYANNPNAYITVSANSSEASVRDRWNTLPKDTKRFIRQVWGKDEIQVKAEVFDILIGYRKYSIKESFEKSPDNQGRIFEKLMVNLIKQVPITDNNGVTTYLPGKTALRLIQAGTAAEELVRMTKDTWVIKNLWTLVGNTQSNVSALWLAGVPIAKIPGSLIEAHNAVDQYVEERMERDNLQLQINKGVVVGAILTEAQQRVAQLSDSLERNAAHVLMEAGLFQTLIEDIDQETDPYSYGTRLERWAEGKTRWIPPRVKSVGKGLLMTHDTFLYKKLNKLTMYSDFTSRMVIYEHLTTRKKNPLSHDEAVREARNMFVNYDSPTHRGVQWANDKGLVFFTKYYMRIQVMLLRLIRDNPARAAALVVLNNQLGYPTILGSSVLSGKQPFKVADGPLEYPGSIDEMITISAIDSILD